MKTFKKYFIGVLILLFAFSACDNGIDPITAVDPGADATAPVVTIKAPLNGAKFKVNDPLISVNIEFEVTDDIEVGSISVFMDGSQIATFTNFIDYRRVLESLTANNIATGVHELKITAIDLDGKSTTSTVSFEKEPPYIPLFANEILYMAFDNDYTELISVVPATKVGSPGFAGTAVVGTNAYKGATDAYLTFPTVGLNLGSELSASFWYKVNASPDRAGILVIGPPDDGKAADMQNNRKNGFRFFRENAGGNQRFKLNVGNGTADTWVDGGTAADVAPGADWVHMAFTISATTARVYIGGQLVKESTFTGIDWTGCDVLSIMSGYPRFTEWGHKSDNSFMDDLRLFSKALTESEIQNIIEVTNPYVPTTGETLYMPFNGNYNNLLNGASANEVGTPGFSDDSFAGSKAFQSATDSYLEMPIDGLFGTEEFTAAFWYKVNSTPDRSGILVVGTPDIAENRNQGFRIFREGNATEQRIKLNLGINSGESWNDGGVIDVTAGEWVHIAVTVSATESNIYFNGEPSLTSTFGSTVDWTGCDNLTIGAGGPTFSYWGHLSDLSIIDELRIFNRALTQEEIQSLQ
ncbi:hypothetical protein CJ739_3033 [Mariniflexile rhizosphaerae]|uniref:LamG-like jellyroll fold domain-containing protein n=1 Tax=unclassified Mariniflexile TaxID=2643887 RepID=UPI000CAE52DC|nr:LamG-like jellyroll fold domain-containing protein [Mariniflexile sp. TRM1-10]AXP82096.1 hypothetical protein CJ739_3033 [Mariniflexile sp. TRM1-10]PLB20261.1 MAG: hypothetical protein TRG1_910 [Flavobacteriaceae bacterium FS1-H7996/R]